MGFIIAFVLLSFGLGVDYGKHGEKYWFDQGDVTMKDLSKLKKYFRDKKSAAFKLVDPGDTGKRLYFESRADYKGVLIQLLLATVDRLQALGVDVRVTIGDDIKRQQTKEAA